MLNLDIDVTLILRICALTLKGGFGVGTTLLFLRICALQGTLLNLDHDGVTLILRNLCFAGYAAGSPAPELPVHAHAGSQCILPGGIQQRGLRHPARRNHFQGHSCAGVCIHSKLW